MAFWAEKSLFIFAFTLGIYGTFSQTCGIERNTCGIGLVRTNFSNLLNTSDNKVCSCPPRNGSDDIFYHCYENGTIHIQSGRWAYELKGALYTISCPFGYCFCEEQTKYGYCILNLTKQCAENRTGTMCSECKTGLSVLFGSEACGQCSDSYLWLLLAFVVVISIVICALFYFNFGAFSGYLNASIYSYQMMVLLIPANVELNAVSFTVIYMLALQGTGNANGYCLFDGMDNLQKLGISYIIPGYLLVFTVFMGNIGYELTLTLWKKVMVCVSQDEESSDLAEENAVDALQKEASRRKSFGSAFSFVLVISYSYCTHITLDIMNYTEFNNTYVVHKAAFVEYFDNVHIWYFILASVVLIFVVILFPVVLLFKRTFEKIFPALYRSEPIFNSLRLCFRDNCQGFAAFYFICRLILILVNIICKDQVAKMIFLSMFSLVFLMFFIMVQPYTTKTYNIWDIIQLGNLCVITNLSLIIQLRIIVKEKIRRRCMAFLNLGIFVPLIIAILRMVAYVYNKKKLCFDFKYNEDEKSEGSDNTENYVIARIKRFTENRITNTSRDKKRRAIVPERVFERFERDSLGTGQNLTARSNSSVFL